MLRHTDRPMGEPRVYTAIEEQCRDCGRVPPVSQNFSRLVEGLDERFVLVRRDRRCGVGCPGSRPWIYAPKDLGIVLPKRIYGLDVTVHVGERHLSHGISLGQVTRDLNARGLPVDQRHTGRIFRDFLALASLARGNEVQVQARLRTQGGIVLMCDGVQFDDRSPVLYLLWDAISGTPLFGKRKLFRGEDDLRPLLEDVRAMQVPVLGLVTDKEKALVSAMSAVFPDVPYQYCHTHFFKNCAKPMHADVELLRASVKHRAERVRDLEKELATLTPRRAAEPLSEPVVVAAPPVESSPAVQSTSVTPDVSLPNRRPASASSSNNATAGEPLTEEGLVRDVCELVRANSRISGKAPLDPPELARHQRLEQIRALVNDAREKKDRRRTVPKTGPCSRGSIGRSR
jgi:hypothetical protein